MEKVKKAVEKYADLMNSAEQYIWQNPEVGYKEFKTNEYMLKAFSDLGYKTERPKDITGFTAYFDTGRKGPTILVLAELDGLICEEHPECDKRTGAVHNCGHNVQCATILGVAGAIKEKSINQELCGKVKFCVVPAEEGIEIEYRNGLKEKGIISFASGKPEFIKRGLMYGVDISFMMHIADISAKNADFWFTKGHNGLIRKQIEITGKAAHAGGSPWDGVNALYAAELVLSACNALRETFKDEDKIRFHPIITKGGDAVNAIPEKVIIETFVRAANIKALKDTNYKINRAVVGACMAIGAKVKIMDSSGSDILNEDDNLTQLMKEQCAKLVGENRIYDIKEWRSSSTDFGDISGLVPAVNLYVDGARGTLHGSNYYRQNPAKTCFLGACVEVATLVELLKDNGKKAYEIIEKFKPVYSSVAEYLETLQSFNQQIDCISYDGSDIKINL